MCTGGEVLAGSVLLHMGELTVTTNGSPLCPSETVQSLEDIFFFYWPLQQYFDLINRCPLRINVLS